MGSSSLLVKQKLSFVAYAIGALLVWAMVGCGGSGGGSTAATPAKVALTIAWPEKKVSRYLPVYASSLVFTLTFQDGEETPRTLTVNRPDTLPLVQTVEFTGPLTSGNYILSGVAMTGPDGTGQVVANATANVFVPPTGVTSVPLTLGSTLYSIDLLDMPLALQVGHEQQLRVRILDKNQNELFIPVSALTWSIVIGKSSASVDDNGLLTASAEGASRVRVSELGANLYSEGQVTVTVAPPPSVRRRK